MMAPLHLGVPVKHTSKPACTIPFMLLFIHLCFPCYDKSKCLLWKRSNVLNELVKQNNLTWRCSPVEFTKFSWNCKCVYLCTFLSISHLSKFLSVYNFKPQVSKLHLLMKITCYKAPELLLNGPLGWLKYRISLHSSSYTYHRVKNNKA